MSKGFELISAFVLVFFSPFQIDAQSHDIKFQHYTIDNGLSQNLIYSICQDGHGFMWFGTKDGLNRFDGYVFKHYHYNPFDSTTIADNAVSALFCDSKKRLWVGTINGSLDLYDPDSDGFYHFLKDNADKGSINSIREDSSGHIWVATYGNGIFELAINHSHPENLRVKTNHYVSRPGDSTSLNSNFVLGIFPDSKGWLWVSTTTGYFQNARLNQPALKFSAPDYPIFRVGRQIRSGGIQFDLSKLEPVVLGPLDFGGGLFTEDSLGRPWVGTPGGFLLVNPERDSLFFFDPVWLPLMESGSVLSLQQVGNPDQDISNYSLWLGFPAGLGILDTHDFYLRFVTNDPGYPESLLPGAILSLYQDRSGCVWLGSSGTGLSKFNLRSTLFPFPNFVLRMVRRRLAASVPAHFLIPPNTC